MRDADWSAPDRTHCMVDKARRALPGFGGLAGYLGR
jgi:hypothetical protein